MSDFSDVTKATLDDLKVFSESVSLGELGTGWSLESLERELALPHGNVRVIREVTAAQVACLMVYWVLPDGIELLNIHTVKAFRRCGLGRRMMVHLVRECERLQLDNIFLEVRGSNHAALELYRGLGFLEAGRRVGYYADGGEDAVVMRLEPLAD